MSTVTQVIKHSPCIAYWTHDEQYVIIYPEIDVRGRRIDEKAKGTQVKVRVEYHEPHKDNSGLVSCEYNGKRWEWYQ